MRNDITTIQALLLCDVAFSWGLRIGNEEAETVSAVLVLVFSTILILIG